jgi:TRAP-type C4-dicarboxylate transport system substrate-binding protein
MNLHKSIWAAAAAVALALAIGAPPSVAKEYKYGQFSPPKANVPNLSINRFNKEVSAKTNGAVSFKIFAGGSLVGPRNTLSGIRDGIVDAGFVVPAFVVSETPHVNLMPDLLSFGVDARQTAAANAETLLLDCPECEQDYAKMGAISLGGMGSNPYILQCAKPISKFQDLKGMKVRVAGSASGRWVDAMGAVPVSGMPPPDIVTGLQRGQVDCAIAIPSWLRGFSMADGVKQLVTMPQGNYHGTSTLTFSLNLWNGLTHDQKGIFLKAAANALAKGTIENAYVVPPRDVEPLIKKKHITKWPGDDDMHAAWTKFLKGEVEAAIVGAKKRGIKEDVARRILTAHHKNLEKWKNIGDKVGTDGDKFAQVMWDEIFSKVKY